MSAAQIWTGTLKAQKKSELQDICRAIGINFRPEALKLELEQEIRSSFKTEPRLRLDPRFEGLTNLVSNNSAQISGPDSAASTPSDSAAQRLNNRRSASSKAGPRRASRQDSDEDDEEHETTRKPREVSKPPSLPPTRSSPRRKSLASAINDHIPSSAELVKAVSAAEKEVGNVIHHASRTIDASPAVKLVKQTGSQAITKVNNLSVNAAELTLSGLQATQYTLSSPWNLWTLKVFAELAYVFYSMVPIDDKPLRTQPNEYLVRLPRSIHAAIHLISSERFLRPLFEYVALTLVVPLIVASLVNFAPAPSAGSRRAGWLQRASNLKPSPLTFSAVRLATVVLLHLVFRPAVRYGWASSGAASAQRTEFLHPGSTTTAAPHLPLRGGWACRNAELVGLDVVQFVMSALGMAWGFQQLLSTATLA